jgi:thymidylate kinase
VTPSHRNPASSVAPDVQITPSLRLIEELSNRLTNEKVDYCHWKSTNALDRSAIGENDLDLLVRRSQIPRFTEILCGLGFKEVRVAPAEELPGVVNFYGLDAGSGRLVHVHAHFQLALGHDRTKNYRLAIEEPFLASAIKSSQLRTPAPEFEFVVFVIRMVLKHFTWDAILGGQATLPSCARSEWRHLHRRVDPVGVSRLLGLHLPEIPEELFAACARALDARTPAYTRVGLGRRLQRAIRAHARRSSAADLRLRLWRRLSRAIRRRLRGHPYRKQLTSGGALIALVGGDGAGKSTAVRALSGWLALYFEVTAVHLGKPPWSRTTRIVRGSLKAARMVHERLVRVRGSRQIEGTFPRFAPLLRRLCAARDRRLAYVRARRFANNGGLVVCDRFPLREIELMDGPILERTLGALPRGRLVRHLIRVEQAQYRPIARPDVLIVLRVDPEIAVRRKTDEDPNSVRTRSREIWERDWRGTSAHVIDAARPPDEVLADIKSCLWSQL